jgi:hypothetical protein
MGHSSSVLAVAFSPDGTRLATGTNIKMAWVWDPNTGQELTRIAHDESVRAVAFSPDRTRLATGSDDRTRVWGLNLERQLPIAADVLFAGRLSDREVAELVHEFKTFGLTVELREVSPRRMLGEIAWLALLAVPLKPFYDQLAEDFAADAHKRLKTLAGKILHRRSPPPAEAEAPRILVLQDTGTGAQVVLEPDLPDEAYQQLLSFDLATIRRGPLHYDRHHHRWRSELDEADSDSAPAPPPDCRWSR